jgi:hypothetical protein
MISVRLRIVWTSRFEECLRFWEFVEPQVLRRKKGTKKKTTITIPSAG